jgi:hypothetical protein
LLSFGAAAALLGAAAPAFADDFDDTNDPWKSTHFEGDVGLLVGGMSIGPLDGFAGGMYAEGGVKRDRLMVLGEYDLMSVGQTPAAEDPNAPPNPVRGYMQRFGLDARYSVGRFGGGDVPVRGDIWLTAGLGGEIIQWYEGGRLHRPDAELGLGAQASFRYGSTGHPKFIGFYYAVRAFIAKAPPSKNDGIPTCAGPCDEPTPPVPWDTGIFFDFGINFGR